MRKLLFLLLVSATPLFAYSGNGTINGSPTFGTGKFSQGLTAVSDANNITLPAAALPGSTSTNSWTIEAWLKTTNTGTQVAVSFGTTYNVWFGSDGGDFEASYQGETLSSGISIDDGAWHHCVMEVSAGTALSTYVDGVAGATHSLTPTAFSGTGQIGNFSVTSGFSWSGDIDEVAIFSTAKYSGAFTPPSAAYFGTEANLNALYHLDGDAVDSSACSGVPTSSGVLATNSCAILYSPYNWVIGSTATTVNSGAYLRTVFTGTSAAIETNTANNASPYSELWARIDGDAWTELSLSSGNPTLTVATGLQSRSHLLEVIVKSTSETLSRWASNAQTMVTITGLLFDSGATASQPIHRSNYILIYGDSITEGVRTVNDTATYDVDRNDVLSDYSYATSTACDCEVGIVGFGGSGVLTAGSGSVPDLESSYNLVYAGATRAFSPAPTLVVYNEGTNDSSNITTGLETVIDAIITAAPSSKHLILVPFNQTHISEIQAAVTAIGSANVTYAGTAGWFNTADSSDGLHPYGVEHMAYIAPRLFPIVAGILGGGGGGGGTSTVGTFSAQ